MGREVTAREARPEFGVGSPVEEPRHRGRRPGRVLRALGVLCLVGAVVYGGYLAWLLWGTGLETARAQRELRQELVTEVEQEPLSSAPVAADPAARRVVVPGDGIAILRIPRMDLDVVAVEGTDAVSLRRGPGHYPETPFPWEDGGRSAFAGHRTTYGHPFWALDTIRAGDRIIMLTRFGTLRYTVTEVFVTHPADLSVLEQTEHPSLVLTTCHPRFSARERLVVIADRDR